MLRNNTLLATVTLLSLVGGTGCYIRFDEGINEYTVRGKVVIPPSAAGLSTFGSLDNPETQEFLANLGVVYVGAFAGVQNDSNTLLQLSGVLESDQAWVPFTLPSYDPASLFTFPYSGTSVGNYTNACVPDLSCQAITGRVATMQGIIDHFDLRFDSGGVYPQSLYFSAELLRQELTSDGELDEAEAAELAAAEALPSMTETQYVDYCLLQKDYFKAYVENSGCTLNEDGTYDLTTCEVSGFEFYGNLPWTVNAEGALEAPFTLYKLALPDDRTGDPVVWAYVDQNRTTCEPTYGYRWVYDPITSTGVYFGGPYEYSLSKPWLFMEPGDLYTHYADASSAVKVALDGTTEVVVQLNGVVKATE